MFKGGGKLMRKLGFISIAALLALVATNSAFASQVDERDRYLIRMGSAELRPTEGARTELPTGHRHLLVQFYGIPKQSQLEMLEDGGIKVLRYVGGHAYIVSLSQGRSAGLEKVPGLRATASIMPEMKISSLFETEERLRRHVEGSEPIGICVRFHDGVDCRVAIERLAASGAETEQKSFYYSNIIQAEACWPVVLKLAAADEIDFIDPLLPPPAPFNGDTRTLVNAADIYKNKQYKRINGRGVNVGIWDAGQVAKHKDFGGRVTNVQTAYGVSDHSTHVAGTIAGSGKGDSEAMGMAARAKVFAYDYTGDPIAEMRKAVKKKDVMISSNSWGYVTGWYNSAGEDGEEDYWLWLGQEGFGYYHVLAGHNLDQFVKSSNFPIVWASGNYRCLSYLGPHRHSFNDDTEFECLHPSGPDYGSIPWWGNAKNCICVGAVMKDGEMTGFSGWGPTDDGRLKPDVVAPGYSLCSTVSNNKYAYMSGTSMATPVVTGVTALLIDYYKRLNVSPAGTEPSKKGKKTAGADTIKALLIHTTRDLGPEGPDFMYGYGMIDAELAAKVLRSLASNDGDITSLLVNDRITDGRVVKHSITVPAQTSELRVTLAWNDPPGKELINDLDLTVSGNGKTIRPFTLNPKKPKATAKKKRNSRDNVEHVVVKNPGAGEWEIAISGYEVNIGPQDCVLIASAGEGNEPLNLLEEGSMRVDKVITSSSDDWDNVVEKDSFSKGDDFWAYLYINIDKNAEYDDGGYYGTVSAKWLIKDSGGSVILKTDYAGDSFKPRDGVWRWRLGKFVIPGGMGPGNYTVEVTVTMHNGQSAKATCSFTVN